MPIVTVERMKRVLERHFRPQGVSEESAAMVGMLESLPAGRE